MRIAYVETAESSLLTNLSRRVECPECGAVLLHVGGCVRCPACGFSPCE